MNRGTEQISSPAPRSLSSPSSSPTERLRVVRGRSGATAQHRPFDRVRFGVLRTVRRSLYPAPGYEERTVKSDRAPESGAKSALVKISDAGRSRVCGSHWGRWWVGKD